jgi:hypothetical protein
MGWLPRWSGGLTENGLKSPTSDPRERSSGLRPLPSGGGHFPARGSLTHGWSRCSDPSFSHLTEHRANRQIALR